MCIHHGRTSSSCRGVLRPSKALREDADGERGVTAARESQRSAAVLAMTARE